MLMFLQLIVRYFARHKLLTLVFLTSLLLEVAYLIAAPASLQYLVDKAFAPRDLQAFIVIMSLLLAGGFLSICASASGDYALAKLGGGIIRKLRSDLFLHLQKQSLPFFERYRIGDLVARFSTDMSSMERVVRITSPFFLKEVLSVLLGLAMLFTIEWRLTLAVLAGSALLFAGPRLLQGRAENDNRRFKEASERFTNTIDEMAKGHKTIRGLHQQGRFRAIAERQIAGLFDLGMKLHMTTAWMERLPQIALLLLNGIMMGFGGYLIFQDQISIGGFIAFFTLFMSVGQSGSNLSMLLPSLIDSAVSFRRVSELLEQPPDLREPEQAVRLSAPIAAVQMDRVTFGYHDETTQLRDVSLRVEAGRYIAFVGPSGSGKSTALQLLGRFYDPRAGRITVDGYELHSIEEASWRQAAVMVTQDTFLFNTTLRDNLALDREELTEAELAEAAKRARIHDVISSWPDGYDTPVHHEGGSLSGGERQRISIARALLRKPQLLLLDEITAALDPAAEADINELILQLRGEQTVVSVTHRLASVVQADHIYVFQDGRIVESGRHHELMNRQGLYHELWEKQHGFQLSPDGRHATVDGERLAKLPFFRDIDHALLNDIATLFAAETCREGDIVVQQGEEGDKFYIIVRGMFEILREQPSGEARIAVLQDGDHFGEIALLKQIPRTATVRALRPSVLLSMRREAFHQLTREHPQLLAGLERSLLERLPSEPQAVGG